MFKILAALSILNSSGASPGATKKRSGASCSGASCSGASCSGASHSFAINIWQLYVAFCAIFLYNLVLLN